MQKAAKEQARLDALEKTVNSLPDEILIKSYKTQAVHPVTKWRAADLLLDNTHRLLEPAEAEAYTVALKERTEMFKAKDLELKTQYMATVNQTLTLPPELIQALTVQPGLVEALLKQLTAKEDAPKEQKKKTQVEN